MCTDYYSALQTLSGLVYDKETDNLMDNELKELSNYVQLLTKLDQLENHVKQIVPARVDYHRLFDIGLDHHHNNLAQVTINFPNDINFPEQNKILNVNIIEMVIENFKNVKTYDFSVSKIIGWIKNKAEFDKKMKQ